MEYWPFCDYEDYQIQRDEYLESRGDWTPDDDDESLSGSVRRIHPSPALDDEDPF